ncbi:MAG: hypothetical protein NZM43_00140 [Saprospiraceae bacterium]|nr:hypothetical protein [Saprospiraceae bacterium]MDW8482710.1 hypothetical protein [Saprospiraceae bacterium]
MHLPLFPFFLIVSSFVLVVSCSSDEYTEVRAYYFPVEALEEGLVYAYAAELGDTTERRYWYYRAFPRDSGLFLVGTQYDRFFQINQIVREKIDASGAIARQVWLYELDSTRQKVIPVEAVIEADDLFPFWVRDSTGVFLYRLKYRPPFDTSAEIYLIRNRRYLGAGPDFNFEGKKYPVIRFSVREAVGHQAEGAAEIEGTGEEWYAKGLGLVYFCKTFGDKSQIQFAFRLRERFPMRELERRAAEAFKQKGEGVHDEYLVPSH